MTILEDYSNSQDKPGLTSAVFISLAPENAQKSSVLKVSVSPVLQSEESLSTKVSREVDLFSEVGSKFCDEVAYSLSQPGETLVKTGSAVAIGAGLSLLTKNSAPIKAVAHGLGIGSTLAIGQDGLELKDTVSSAMVSSWKSADGHNFNRQFVGESVAHFAYDSLLYGAAGTTGSLLGQNYLRSQALREIKVPVLKFGEATNAHSTISTTRGSELGALYEKMTSSVGRVEVLAHEGKGLAGRYGTAFALSADGTLVTNHHVVQDALEVTVFDARGRAHLASVVKESPQDDLAVLRLKDFTSRAHFKPVPLGSSQAVKANEAGKPVFTLGYPEGIQKPFLSLGETTRVPKVDPLNMKVHLHSEHGNSGGPIFDEQGRLMGVLKQGARSDSDYTLMTPVERLSSLASVKNGSASESITSIFSRKAPVAMHHQYVIDEPAAALANAEKLFPLSQPVDAESALFHSKITRTNIVGNGGKLEEVALRTQYRPHSREIVVEPLQYAGSAIESGKKWPGSSVNMDGSRLVLKLDRRNNPVKMEAFNDPMMVLPRAFDYKSQGNYLPRLIGQENSHSLAFKIRHNSQNFIDRVFGSVHFQ
jgi:S1-C subfamily serine protease